MIIIKIKKSRSRVQSIVPAAAGLRRRGQRTDADVSAGLRILFTRQKG